YNRYFNPTSVAKIAARNTRLGGVTNAVYDDFKRVMGSPRIGKCDQSRLDNYMSLMSDLQKQFTAPVVACNQAAPGAMTNYDQIQSAAIDLEVAALSCGITKIVMHGLFQYIPDMPAGRDTLFWHGFAHNPVQVVNGVSQVVAAPHNQWQAA